LPKEAEVANDVRVDAIINDRPEGVVNPKVARITNENLMHFGILDADETVPGVSTDDTDQA
jgi:hypothetical protein